MKSFVAIVTLVLAGPLLHAEDRRIPNELIDYRKYLQIASGVQPVREQRRLTEDQFIAFAAEPGTIVLDARSADKFKLRHVKGAVSLPFTDFTAESLVIQSSRSKVFKWTGPR